MYKVMYKVTFKNTTIIPLKVKTIGQAFIIIDNYCNGYDYVYGLGNISTQNGKIIVTIFNKENNPIEAVIENI